MRDMTLINTILDRSGSMMPIAEEVVGMYNRFINEQKQLPDYAEVSLIQFDDIYEIYYLRKPVKDCEPLVLSETYTPRGMTALLDAVGITINKIDSEFSEMADHEKPQRVLFVILTDGHENASREFTNKAVKKMIDDRKEKYEWDFIFLGAGIDAFAEGTKFGMTASKTADFSHSSAGMDSAGKTISSYATTYRATGDAQQDLNNFKK